MEPLTKKEELVYNFMFHFFEEEDQPPPITVIQKHFEWKSSNAAQWYIKRLLQKGWIEHNSIGKYRFTRSRGVRLS